MRLSRIDIKGFKSFATDTVLHFSEPVTGVVGPNGSGKSNIVDAVRWVLGEQKGSELRLERMSDVIFNGTQKKKPGGLAQVSISFDNTRNLLPTEYQNVTISRLLYRTGESEYRINNVTCRLKDITNLFQDTGVAANSYAIISLGMVDELLIDKDHTRRKMIEQAAGVSKYKQKKHETLLRLKSTEEDLNRVDDLLFEINQNLETLEKQAKRTQKYFELKKDYQDKSIHLTQLRTQDLAQRKLSLEEQISTQEVVLLDKMALTNTLEAKVEEDKRLHLEKESQLSGLQKELNQVIANIRQLENDKSLGEQQLQFNNTQLTRLTTLIEQHGEKRKQLAAQAEALSQRLTKEKQVIIELKSSLEESSKTRDMVFGKYGAARTELDSIKKAIDAKSRQHFELEKNIAVAQNRIQQNGDTQQRLNYQIGLHNSQSADIQRHLEGLIPKMTELDEKLMFLKDQKQKHDVLLSDLQVSLEQEKSVLVDINRSLDAKKNEFNLLKDLIENYEGFPESIPFLLKHNIKAPLLSDIIYCPEDYRIILELYLEAAMNYFVVESYKEAYSAIQLLSSSQKGKSSFFILDCLPAARPSREIPGATPVLGILETEEKYQPLINHLFGQVYLVDELEIFVNNPLHHDQVFIKKDGLAISRRQGLLGGGSIGLFEGKTIGRKKQLEKLQKEIDKLTTKKVVLDERVEGIQNQIKTNRIPDLPHQIEQTTRQWQQIQHQVIEFQTKLKGEEKVKYDYAQQIAKLEEEKKIYAVEMSQNQAALITQKNELTLEEEEAKARGKDYEDLLTAYNQESQNYNEQHIRFIQQENLIKQLDEQIRFTHRQKEDLEIDFGRQTQQFESNQEEKNAAILKVSQLDQELNQKYSIRKELESYLSNTEEVYYKSRGSIHEEEEQLKRYQRDISSDQQILLHLKDKLNNTKFELQALWERIKIEFKLEIDPTFLQPGRFNESELDTLDSLEQKVLRLKKSLDNFGEINPMAIEAYNEIKERHDHIYKQRQDILDAKTSLLNTISAIETTATNTFMEAFNNVRANFIMIFRELFEETDQCDLLLTVPDNPLESDIEIMAKPKGKKPLTLHQLSGGEKTLTAIALLFSMYLLKPAPFCIFDEVDAPLDDINVEKFNRIIRKFSQDSQFIIVTHNKLTMAAVDVIYGVYMEEMGISGVSQVDFRAYEHSSLTAFET